MRCVCQFFFFGLVGYQHKVSHARTHARTHTHTHTHRVQNLQKEKAPRRGKEQGMVICMSTRPQTTSCPFPSRRQASQNTLTKSHLSEDNTRHLRRNVPKEKFRHHVVLAQRERLPVSDTEGLPPECTLVMHLTRHKSSSRYFWQGRWAHEDKLKKEEEQEKREQEEEGTKAGSTTIIKTAMMMWPRGKMISHRLYRDIERKVWSQKLVHVAILPLRLVSNRIGL